MVDINDLINDLNKLDKYLNIQTGTTASIIAYHKPDHVDELNEKLHGIIINRDGTIDKKYRQEWAKLLQTLGISRAWWMNKDPSVAELEDDIKVL